MGSYCCPLCEQEVSKELYERITGIWQEKEKIKKELQQERKALQHEKLKLKEHLESERKRLIAQQQKNLELALKKQEKAFSAKLLQVERESKKKDTTMEAERLALQKEKAALKDRFEAQQHRLAQQHDRRLALRLEKQEKAFQSKLQALDRNSKRKEAAVEKEFAKKAAAEINNFKREEKAKQYEVLQQLKINVARNAESRLQKAKEAVGKARQDLERRERLHQDRNMKLVKQYQTLQTRSAKELEARDKKIKSLQEQAQKNQTPQVLGLLEEQTFLDCLRKEFPRDHFEHTGKGGDIVHRISHQGKVAGTIAYELKKVATFQSKHIEQALKAKLIREADYGILVTNAKRSKSESGFFQSRGVIIIDPAGVLVLVSILRENLIQISKLNLSAEERNNTIRAVLDYIQSPVFSNSIRGIIQDTHDLYDGLKKEIQDHAKRWQDRLSKYRAINFQANQVESKVVRLLITDGKKSTMPAQIEMVPIALPSEIK